MARHGLSDAGTRNVEWHRGGGDVERKLCLKCGTNGLNMLNALLNPKTFNYIIVDCKYFERKKP